MVRIGGIFGRHFGGEGGCINTPSFLPSLPLLYPSLPLVDEDIIITSPNTDNESPFNSTNQTSGDDFNASSHHMRNSTSSCCELPLSLPNLTPEITNADPAITPLKPEPSRCVLHATICHRCVSSLTPSHIRSHIPGVDMPL